MQPTDILKKEHETVLTVLNILDKISEGIRTGLEINVADLDQLMEILKEYVDRNHHGKEENILFPALEKLGLSRENGPVGVMLMEHDNGREYIQGMRDSISEFKAGKTPDLKKFAINASYYTQLMQDHIYKENNILYPMSDMRLTQEEKDLMNNDFEAIEKERIGEGKAEDYLQKIKELEKVFQRVRGKRI